MAVRSALSDIHKRLARTGFLYALPHLAAAAAIMLGWAAFFLDGRLHVVLGDDAMISMRYARNLSDGHGLYWNEGGSPAGYTNLLWTLLMVLPHAAHLPNRLTSAVVLGYELVLGVVYLVVMARLARRLSLSVWACTLSAGLSLQLLEWSAAGFETTALATLAVCMASAVMDEKYAQAGWLGAVALLFRDDALLLSVGLAAMRGLEPKQRLRLLGPAMVALVSIMLFRRLYYGDWLPNTYHLKLTGWPVGARLFLGGRYLVFAAPLLALALFAQRRLPFAWRWALLTGGYVLWAGGDAFPGTRLLVPVWPLASIGVAIISERRPFFGLLAGAILAFTPFDSDTLDTARSLTHPWPKHWESSRLRKFTNENARGIAECDIVRSDAKQRGLSKPSMAVYYAGTPPYFCDDFRAIDVLGKSDEHISHLPVRPGIPAGHNKWDFDYSLGVLKPDYFLSIMPVATNVFDKNVKRAPPDQLDPLTVIDSAAFQSRCANHKLQGGQFALFRCERVPDPDPKVPSPLE